MRQIREHISQWTDAGSRLPCRCFAEMFRLVVILAMLFDRGPIPVDANSGRRWWRDMPSHHCGGRGTKPRQLRNVFDPAAIRDRAGERYVQFHEEMRCHRRVKAFGEVRHLEPGGDAANSGDIDLDNRAAAAL